MSETQNAKFFKFKVNPVRNWGGIFPMQQCFPEWTKVTEL